MSRRSPLRLALRIAAMGAVIGVSIGSASSASGATAEAGLWYYNLLNVQAAHDAGWTGKGVTIAVIDGQINTAVPELAGADIVTHPVPTCLSKAGAPISYTSVTSDISAFHATNVVSLIAGNGKSYTSDPGVLGVAPGAKILFYTAGPEKSGSEGLLQCYSKGTGAPSDNAGVASQIVDAVNAGAQIISVSLGLASDSMLPKALAYAENHGVVVLGALPDTLVQGLGDAPAINNGVVSVQAGSTAGSVLLKDPTVDVTAPGVGILTQGAISAKSWTVGSTSDGTSLATPIVAGFLADVKQKYPNATGNQLIQTLIRNTGASAHPLDYETTIGIGYGTVSLTHMLAVDPTTYPDTNPLVSKSSSFGPTAAQIAAAGSAPKTSSPSATPNAKPAGKTGSILPLILGGVIGLLVIAAIIVIIVIVVTRRSRVARNRT